MWLLAAAASGWLVGAFMGAWAQHRASRKWLKEVQAAGEGLVKSSRDLHAAAGRARVHEELRELQRFRTDRLSRLLRY